MNLRRFATVLLLSGVTVVATATPAFAHAELIGSSPAQNESLAAAPQQVQLTFSEAVALPATPVTITGPSGASWTVGQASIAGAVVTVPVTPSGPAGPYTLTYNVISDDGDAVNGTVPFTLTAATTETTEAPTSTSATAAATTDEDSGVPVWMWILGAVVLVVVGLVVALRVGRGEEN